jgi:hypothetical protein
MMVTNKFECVFIRLGSRQREPAMHELWGSVSQQDCKQVAVFGIGLEIALHDNITRRCSERRPHQVWVAMTKKMDPYPDGKVEQPSPVSSLDPRSTPEP